jgi:hypothetical protein
VRWRPAMTAPRNSGLPQVAEFQLAVRLEPVYKPPFAAMTRPCSCLTGFCWFAESFSEGG